MIKIKQLSILFTPLFLTPIFLASCSPNNNQLVNPTPPPTDFNDPIEFEKPLDPSFNIEATQDEINEFITQRSFSLKLISSTLGPIFGTTWLFAKENDDKTPNNFYDDTYYLATNLHVAANIQNINKTLYKYSGENKPFVASKYGNISKIYLGQIIDDNDSNNDNKYDKMIYDAYLPIDAVSITYTPIDLFKTLDIDDIYNIYDTNIIDNGAMDLAILKMDFSKLQFELNNEEYKQHFYNCLKAYNNNPTTYSSYTGNQNITIGGFPLTTNKNQLYTFSYHPTPNNKYSISEQKDNLIASYIANDTLVEFNQIYGYSGAKSFDDFKHNYIYPNDIAFATDEFASYTNVALEANFTITPKLIGGTSGSMVVDDKLNVVGIYWGNLPDQSAVIDLFINNNTYSLNNRKIIEKYNIINDFIQNHPNTNLNFVYKNRN